MSILFVDYSALDNSIKYANKAAAEARDYAENIDKKVCRKLMDLTGGSNANISNADWFASKKMDDLNKKAERLETYAARLEKFGTHVEEVDKGVKNSFNSLAATFKKNNNIQISPVREFFVRLFTESINATEFGRWVKDAFNTIGDFRHTIKDELKYWYECEGGKYWVDIGLAVVAVVAAIITIAIAGAGFFAVVAIIGSVIAIVNGLVDIGTAGKALLLNDTDPAKAQRYGKMEKASDVMDTIVTDNNTVNRFLYTTGDLIDATEAFCDLVGVMEIGNTVIQMSGKTTALKNLFGDKNSGLGSKFLSNKTDEFTLKNVATWDSFKNGSKSLIMDQQFRSDLWRTFKSDIRTDFSTIKDSFKISSIKESGRYLKTSMEQGKDLFLRSFSTDVNDANRAREVLGDMVKDTVFKDFTGKAKRIDQLSTFNDLNGLQKIVSKYSKQSKAILLMDNIGNKKFETAKSLYSGDITALVPKPIKNTLGLGEGDSVIKNIYNIFQSEQNEGKNLGFKEINIPVF